MCSISISAYEHYRMSACLRLQFARTHTNKALTPILRRLYPVGIGLYSNVSVERLVESMRTIHMGVRIANSGHRNKLSRCDPNWPANVNQLKLIIRQIWAKHVLGCDCVSARNINFVAHAHWRVFVANDVQSGICYLVRVDNEHTIIGTNQCDRTLEFTHKIKIITIFFEN